MDVHVEEQPHVIVREEFLHNPSTLSSHHLNVTVIVQDKGRTDPARELQAVGKAVLDTANYSEDLFSFTMSEKLNATHLCYPALQTITVCSGLDGQCYLNNQICDLKILFHSYDDECQSISLPIRVNRKTEIDILFSRNTVNKYDFWSLIPFDFGIFPELSAENKKKSDARKRDFDKKEALLKLDPMYQHKHTRCMIALGAEPDIAEVESITPHCDKLKYPGGKPSKKRETYGLQEYPNKKSILHGQSTSKSNVSCVHTMLTCNDTQMEIEGVATQDSCGDVGFERLNSVTPILAKRMGDTPHLGGDQIPTLTHTFEDSDTPDYVTEPLWPSGVALSVDEIDDSKIDTFAPFLAKKPSQDDLPKGPEDFLNKITFEGDESFQGKLRELCSEYPDIFSDQLAEILPPTVITRSFRLQYIYFPSTTS